MTKEKEKRLKETRTTKVVVRCLPPALTEEEFSEVVSFPEYEYFYYIKADRSLGEYAYSRAYIKFKKEEDIIPFRDTWDGYEFQNPKGVVYPAVVEFAPYQKVPKITGKKADPRCGTLEDDADYKKFLEALNVAVESLPSAEAMLEEIESKSKDDGKVVTPLIEFLKQKRLEKLRAREEAREERRRKEKERRLKQEEEKRRKKDEERRKREREKEKREKEEKVGKEKDVEKAKGKPEPKITLLKKPAAEKKQAVIPCAKESDLERDRNKERDKDRIKERDGERAKDKDRTREREREKNKDRDKERRDQTKTKVSEKNLEKDREQDWKREKERQKDRNRDTGRDKRRDMPMSIQGKKSQDGVKESEKKGGRRDEASDGRRDRDRNRGGSREENKLKERSIKEDEYDSSRDERRTKEKRTHKDPDRKDEKRSSDSSGRDSGRRDVKSERQGERSDDRFERKDSRCSGGNYSASSRKEKAILTDDMSLESSAHTKDAAAAAASSKTQDSKLDERFQKTSGEKGGDKKPQRIRNKDRPAMALYQPGQRSLSRKKGDHDPNEDHPDDSHPRDSESKERGEAVGRIGASSQRSDKSDSGRTSRGGGSGTGSKEWRGTKEGDGDRKGGRNTDVDGEGRTDRKNNGRMDQGKESFLKGGERERYGGGQARGVEKDKKSMRGGGGGVRCSEARREKQGDQREGRPGGKRYSDDRPKDKIRVEGRTNKSQETKE